MSDPAFTEEFDIVADEIAALYVSDQFEGEEKERVEQYFLKSPERQKKVKFMVEFLRQIADGPPQPVNAAAIDARSPKPGLFERLRWWWTSQSPSFRAATAFATVVIVVGAVFLSWPRTINGPSYASLELTMTSAERGAGTHLQTINLSGKDELHMRLKVPDDAPAATSYRAQLLGDSVSRQLPLQQEDSKSLTTVVAANELTRGSYAIELTAVAADGTQTPLRGAYLFVVQ